MNDIIDILTNLSVEERWDCYNDKPSGYFYLALPTGLESKQKVEQLNMLIKMLVESYKVLHHD